MNFEKNEWPMRIFLYSMDSYRFILVFPYRRLVVQIFVITCSAIFCNCSAIVKMYNHHEPIKFTDLRKQTWRPRYISKNCVQVGNITFKLQLPKFTWLSEFFKPLSKKTGANRATTLIISRQTPIQVLTTGLTTSTGWSEEYRSFHGGMVIDSGIWKSHIYFLVLEKSHLSWPHGKDLFLWFLQLPFCCPRSRCPTRLCNSRCKSCLFLSLLVKIVLQETVLPSLMWLESYKI